MLLSSRLAYQNVWYSIVRNHWFQVQLRPGKTDGFSRDPADYCQNQKERQHEWLTKIRQMGKERPHWELGPADLFVLLNFIIHQPFF